MLYILSFIRPLVTIKNTILLKYKNKYLNKSSQGKIGKWYKAICFARIGWCSPPTHLHTWSFVPGIWTPSFHGIKSTVSSIGTSEILNIVNPNATSIRFTSYLWQILSRCNLGRQHYCCIIGKSFKKSPEIGYRKWSYNSTVDPYHRAVGSGQLHHEPTANLLLMGIWQNLTAPPLHRISERTITVYGSRYKGAFFRVGPSVQTYNRASNSLTKEKSNVVFYK